MKKTEMGNTPGVQSQSEESSGSGLGKKRSDVELSKELEYKMRILKQENVHLEGAKRNLRNLQEKVNQIKEEIESLRLKLNEANGTIPFENWPWWQRWLSVIFRIAR